MKILLTLHRNFTVDTDTWGNGDPVHDALCNIRAVDTANPTEAELKDAVRQMLEEDIEAVIGNLDLDYTDFTINIEDPSSRYYREEYCD